MAEKRLRHEITDGAPSSAANDAARSTATTACEIPVMFSCGVRGCRDSGCRVASWANMPSANMNVLEAVVGWEWAVGPVIVCGLSTLLAIVLPLRLATGDPTPGLRVAIRIAGGDHKRLLVWITWVSVGSGMIVAYQIVDDSWRTLLWLGAGHVALIVCHVYRSDKHPLRTAVLTAARSAMIAACAGIAIVAAMQAVLASMMRDHQELVEHWKYTLAVARAWLERALPLGLLKVALFLVALIIVVALPPSFGLTRIFRKITPITTYVLLTLTAATSFAFFAGHHALRWQHDLVAKHSHELRSQLDQIDRANAEIIKLMAIEDVMGSLSESQRDGLLHPGSGIDRNFDRKEIPLEILERLDERISIALAAACDDQAADVEPSSRRTEDALSHIYRVEIAPTNVELDDLEILGAEIARIPAAIAEARGELDELGEVIDGLLTEDTLQTKLVQRMSERIDLCRRPVRRLLDHTTVHAAMLRTTSRHPRYGHLTRRSPARPHAAAPQPTGNAEWLVHGCCSRTRDPSTALCLLPGVTKLLRDCAGS